MTTTAEKVVTDALTLPPAMRAFIAEKLIESLDVADAPPLSVAWQKELLRRCQEVDRCAVELRSADAVFAKAYAALG